MVPASEKSAASTRKVFRVYTMVLDTKRLEIKIGYLTHVMVMICFEKPGDNIGW